MAILTALETFARWKAETTRGTNVSAGSFTSAGFVSGGSVDVNENVQLREGIAGQVQQRGGLIDPTASISLMVQSKTLILKAFRASYPAGALPPFTFEAGNSGVGGDGYQLLGAVINTMGVNASVGDPLTIDLGFTAMEYKQEDRPAHVLLTGDVLEWYSGDVTIGGADYKARSATVSLTNNDQREAVLNAPASGVALRRYDEFGIGPEEVSASYELLAPIAFAPVDTLPALASVITFTKPSGDTGDAVTFTLSNLVRNSVGVPLDAGDSIYTQSLETIGKPQSLVVT